MRLINFASNPLRTWASLLVVSLLAAVVSLPAQAQSTERAGDAKEFAHSSSVSGSSADASSEGLRVFALDGPTRAYAGEPLTYRALIEREGLSSSMPYRWQFEKGRPEVGAAKPAVEMISKHLAEQSKLAATYTYDRPGTYTVRLSVGQGEEEATASAVVTITDSSSSEPDKGATIASAQNSRDANASGSGRTANRPGQWGIVVASMRSLEKAEIVAEQYRGQFRTERMPVEVMEADLEDGRHFRVIIGQFESETVAWQTISSSKEKLPVQTWTVRYQERFLSKAGS